MSRNLLGSMAGRSRRRVSGGQRLRGLPGVARSKRSVGIESLESRLCLSQNAAGLEYHAEGTNWIEANFFPHNRHADHVTWDPSPTSDGTITVTVLVHNHGNLDVNRLARFDDAIAEINSAATNFGVGLNVVKVTDPGAAHNIHAHEDTTSGCGSGALGCAEFAIFIAHSGQYSDGHFNHRYAGQETTGGLAEATVLSRSDWFTGTGTPAPNQFDYQTVATQEILHLVGMDHDCKPYNKDAETVGNTDRRSVMCGTLSPGIARRNMSTHDQQLLKHLYGSGQGSSSAASDGHGNGGLNGGHSHGDADTPEPGADAFVPLPLPAPASGGDSAHDSDHHSLADETAAQLDRPADQGSSDAERAFVASESDIPTSATAQTPPSGHAAPDGRIIDWLLAQEAALWVLL